jgi:hypothetical protein
VASQYCQPADLSLTGINPLALVNVQAVQLVAACQQASELADSWGFRGRYGNNTPILLNWGQDVTLMVAKLAVALALGCRGYNPDAGADNIVDWFWKTAEDWLKGVGSQHVHPDVTPNVAIGQNSGADLPQVNTSQQRGWLTFNGSGKPTVGW